MLSTMPYLREDFLLQYEGLTEEFLRNGTITKDHTSIIVKSVLLLNNIYHKPSARQMIYNLLHLLRYDMSKLFLPHISYLQKVDLTVICSLICESSYSFYLLSRGVRLKGLTACQTKLIVHPLTVSWASQCLCL